MIDIALPGVDMDDVCVRVIISRLVVASSLIRAILDGIYTKNFKNLDQIVVCLDRIAVSHFSVNKFF